MSFKLGEKVRLSGGPIGSSIMTVCRPHQLTVGGEPIREIEPGKVCCEWHDKVTGELIRELFDQEALEPYKEPEEE